MLEGQDVNLTEAQIEETENVFSYGHALDKIFSRLWKESADLQRKERKLWRSLEKIAKEQYPDFDTKQHALSYSWNRQRLVIIAKEENDEPGID